MQCDHDDVGDIAVLHGLASLGEIRIIGMMVSSKNYGTAQFMDAVNTWYYARPGQVGRMIGGVFEGSNAQNDGYVTLATVASASDQTWTTVLVKGAAPYRYLRYRGPNNGSCNVAEVEFHGTGGR